MRNTISSKGLRIIPGVGPCISRDLIDLGYTSTSDLKGADPELMYQRFCELRGQKVDRCVLYVFRCAVYFVNTKTHDPELLKWWNWKDKK
jgi:hypothetical protein